MKGLDGLLDALFGAGMTTMSPALMALALLLALAASQPVAWVYMATHSGVSYSRGYVQSIVLLAVIVALVMMIVGTNVFVAFGLIGALAMIRFRNVLKDTRDTAYIFMAVAIGLGAGTMNFGAVIIGTIGFILLALLLKGTAFGTRVLHDAFLRFEAPPGSSEYRDVLVRHCLRTSMISSRTAPGRDSIDFAFRLLLRDPSRSQELVKELNATQGIAGVSLLQEEDQSEI